MEYVIPLTKEELESRSWHITTVEGEDPTPTPDEWIHTYKPKVYFPDGSQPAEMSSTDDREYIYGDDGVTVIGIRHRVNVVISNVGEYPKSLTHEYNVTPDVPTLPSLGLELENVDVNRELVYDRQNPVGFIHNVTPKFKLVYDPNNDWRNQYIVQLIRPVVGGNYITSSVAIQRPLYDRDNVTIIGVQHSLGITINPENGASAPGDALTHEYNVPMVLPEIPGGRLELGETNVDREIIYSPGTTYDGYILGFIHNVTPQLTWVPNDENLYILYRVYLTFSDGSTEVTTLRTGLRHTFTNNEGVTITEHITWAYLTEDRGTLATYPETYPGEGEVDIDFTTNVFAVVITYPPPATLSRKIYVERVNVEHVYKTAGDGKNLLGVCYNLEVKPEKS